MAPKKKKKKVVKNKNDKEIAYLNKLIKLSLKQVNGKSKGLDSLFKQQANKLQTEIDILEQNQ